MTDWTCLKRASRDPSCFRLREGHASPVSILAATSKARRPIRTPANAVHEQCLRQQCEMSCEDFQISMIRPRLIVVSTDEKHLPAEYTLVIRRAFR